jgi:hypothetical protein
VFCIEEARTLFVYDEHQSKSSELWSEEFHGDRLENYVGDSVCKK